MVDIESGGTDSSLAVGGAGGECDSSSSFLMTIMSVLDLARDLLNEIYYHLWGRLSMFFNLNVNLLSICIVPYAGKSTSPCCWGQFC